MSFSLGPDLLKGWTVVVVDDEPDSLEVAQTLLQMCGATVYTGSNGHEGYELCVNHRPKFIISDLSMPEMSGWELIHKLKTTPVTSSIPVIALTAHAMKGDRELAMGAGFHNHLSKPLQPNNFVVDVLSLLVDIPEIEALLTDKF